MLHKSLKQKDAMDIRPAADFLILYLGQRLHDLKVDQNILTDCHKMNILQGMQYTSTR